MSEGELKLPDGSTLNIDEKGYLLDHALWSPEVAGFMAATDGIQLGEDHWVVLKILQAYYEQFEVEPPMRALVKRVREQLGDEKGSSRFLYRLFPDGPVTQGVRYAGLPRPLSCV